MTLADAPGWSIFLGVLGGVVAVTLKGGIDFFFDRRREQRAAKAAARLVAEELHRLHRYVYFVIKWKDARGVQSPFPMLAWRDHNTLLATVLDDELWAHVADAYRVADKVAGMYAPERLSRRTNPLDQFDLADLKGFIVTVGGGLSALRVASGVQRRHTRAYVLRWMLRHPRRGATLYRARRAAKP